MLMYAKKKKTDSIIWQPIVLYVLNYIYDIDKSKFSMSCTTSAKTFPNERVS